MSVNDNHMILFLCSLLLIFLPATASSEDEPQTADEEPDSFASLLQKHGVFDLWEEVNAGDAAIAPHVEFLKHLRSLGSK